jgi:2-dehydropantoate 2-reductase
MKVAILGAGAVGLSIAAKLSEVCDVHAVTRRRHIDAIRKRGFVMTGIWGNETYRFSCAEDLPADGDFDYIIITAKSGATRSICEQFGKAITGHETVSLQNGIGNEEIIAAYTLSVIGGMIITGFEWQGDAHVHVSVEAGPIKFGRFPSGSDTGVERLVDLFHRAGLQVEASTEIRGDLWGKTLYNCALNPLGAIMGVPYGALDNPAAWRIIAKIVGEAFAVCEAEGIKLQWETPEEYLAYLRDEQLPATAQHHSSMLQDIISGKKTEIDFLNGAVVAKGGAHGISTPINGMITDLITFKETLNRGQGVQ